MSGWSGRRILVTGHTGFKGSWLSFWLAAAGADVTGFALPPSTNPHLFGLLDIPGKVRSLLGDVRDAAAVKRAVQTADPEVIFHLAAQAEVRAGYADPLGTFDVNVMGTANVLEAARERRELRAVVVVTSDKCYGNDDRETAYREDDCLGGDDPYSASKACAELVAGAYRRSFFGGGGCGVATARAGNVIGGGDWSRDRLVPDLVRSLVGGTPLSLRNPGAVRPWQHVLDPLAGYLTLAQQLCDGAAVAEAWNFGPSPERPVSVAELAQRFYASWGLPLEWAHDSAAGAPEARHLTLDAGKAVRRLRWASHVSNDDAIDWTVEWYKAWRSGRSPEAITADQIARYQDGRA